MIRILLLLALTPAFVSAAPRLSQYQVDPNGISISGVSSGAYMAVQMQVAFSKTFMGAASVAGGTYWCAKGDLHRAETACETSPAMIQNAEQVAAARDFAEKGAIDPLVNLNAKPLYVFASPRDLVIDPGNSLKLVEFANTFGMNATLVNSLKSAHGFPTLDNGGPCGFAMLPWILKCGYDTAGEILKTVYGTLNPKGQAQPSHLLKFSQSEFGDAQTPLFSEGWVYVPASCAGGGLCKLHVALHGCQMNPDYIQDQFARLSGYNDWAESNRIIVLYPQSAKLASSNPYACWDWFGFTGAEYVTQSGAQMAALKKMIDRVGGATSK